MQFMSSSSFQDLQLHPSLHKAIDACGFTTPTPIQQEAIPIVLEGRDLMASAQTGTGKTAAFVLPALQRLITNRPGPGRGPRVLVVTPTRELAMQIDKDIRQFSRFARVWHGNVVGGLSYGPQIKLLSRPLDLLVATPGRLMDHMREGRVDFARLEVLVLDEADRMLDMGFVKDVRHIAAATPSTRQTLLFSATLEGQVLEIARSVTRDAAKIQLAANRDRHAMIEQLMHHADDAQHKQQLLTHHLSSQALTRALIFTSTKRRADRLSKTLTGQGHSSAALHGDMSQAARRRTVEQLRMGQVRLLVATDVASRGLDIKGISHVINFDLPMVAEDYIHRIGRTGRAGATGTAISLVGPEDWAKLASIEKLTGSKLKREALPGLEPTSEEPTRPVASRPSGGARRFGGFRPPRQGGGFRGGNRGRFARRASAR